MAKLRGAPTPTFGIGRKTRLAVGAALCALLAILFLPLQAIVLTGFTQLEARTVTNNVERALNAIADERSGMLQLARDYAAWDATYAFAQDGNADYITQNYSADVFVANRLNLMLILDRAGQVIAYQTRNLIGTQGPGDPDGVLAAVLGSALTQTISDSTGSSGMLLLPGAPIVLSSHPILTSSYSGPSAGTLIMGRLLDQPRVEDISKSLRLNVSLHRLDRADPSIRGTTAAQIVQSSGPVVAPLDRDRVAGYGLIRSSAGEPLLAVEVDQPREITAIGQQTILYTLGAFIVAALLFALTINLLLNRIVLARLDVLITGVRAIGAEQSLAQRVILDGSDELSLLATTINQTMGSLERAEQEQRAAEEQRRKMWEDVIASRRNFLATVSHELRTPLTPMRGYVDMLLGGFAGSLTPEQQQFLEVIRSNNRHMQTLVDDLLVMGQLDAGRTELNLEPLSLAEAIEAVVALFEQQIKQQGVDVTLDLAPDLPPVAADAHRLSQILTNLISNAVKYTPRGGRVAVRARTDGDRAVVTVSDTGIGMSPAEMARLFTPFYRTDRVLRDQIGGTGLGLSIARSLAELHGGTISVESEPDVGSSFTFSLAVFAAHAERQHEAGALAGRA